MTPLLPQYHQQFNHLANTLDSLQLNPNVLKNKKIKALISSNNLDNVINDWHWLLSKLAEDEALKVESDFFKPHWIPVEANQLLRDSAQVFQLLRDSAQVFQHIIS